MCFNLIKMQILRRICGSAAMHEDKGCIFRRIRYWKKKVKVLLTLCALNNVSRAGFLLCSQSANPVCIKLLNSDIENRIQFFYVKESRLSVCLCKQSLWEPTTYDENENN